MLAALLPLLEALGAEGAAGGAAASIGGGVAARGGAAGLLRMFGGAQAFGSEAELGTALRQISDLSDTVKQAQEAMDQKRERQEQIAAKARDDEKKYLFSDPQHTQQLADLMQQQQAHADEIRQAQRQMQALQSRAAMTVDPRAANAATTRQALGLVGAGTAVAAFAPSIIRNSPPVQITANLAQAGANVGQNFMGPTQSGIAGEAVQTAGNIAGAANPINVGLHPGRAVSELAVELSTLPAKIVKWGDALVESQRTISRFDGRLARSFAEQERRTVIRGIESGARTGGTTSELSNKLQNLYDTLQPIKDEVTVVMAKALGSGVDALESLLKSTQAIVSMLEHVPLIARFLDQIKKEMEANQKKARDDIAGPIGRAFDDAINRKRGRLGVPKR